MRSSWACLLLTLSVASYAGGQPTTTVPPSWRHVDVGVFSFYCPNDIVENHDAHAIDSFAKEYRSSRITLDFDYGTYSNNLTRYNESKPPLFPTHKEQVGGKEVWIGSFRAITVVSL